MTDDLISRKEAVIAILAALDEEPYDMWDKGYNRGLKAAARIIEKNSGCL